MMNFITRNHASGAQHKVSLVIDRGLIGDLVKPQKAIINLGVH